MIADIQLKVSGTDSTTAGIALYGSFGSINPNAYTSALAFGGPGNDNGDYIGRIVSHEAGHTLNLGHFGVPGQTGSDLVYVAFNPV